MVSKSSKIQTRTQLPLQLAFGITLHSAQGQTLPRITLRSREWSVSRARDRYGLAIVKEITSLRELNQPLPPELVQEMKRLAHNTMVDYDKAFCGNRVAVPDAESEAHLHERLPTLEIYKQIKRQPEGRGNWATERSVL